MGGTGCLAPHPKVVRERNMFRKIWLMGDEIIYIGPLKLTRNDARRTKTEERRVYR